MNFRSSLLYLISFLPHFAFSVHTAVLSCLLYHIFWISKCFIHTCFSTFLWFTLHEAVMYTSTFIISRYPIFLDIHWHFSQWFFICIMLLSSYFTVPNPCPSVPIKNCLTVVLSISSPEYIYTLIGLLILPVKPCTLDLSPFLLLVP